MLEKTSKIIESNHPPNVTILLNHTPKCHMYLFFKRVQGWGLNHLPGQPVPMSDRKHHLFSKTYLYRVLCGGLGGWRGVGFIVCFSFVGLFWFVF